MCQQTDYHCCGGGEVEESSMAGSGFASPSVLNRSRKKTKTERNKTSVWCGCWQQFQVPHILDLRSHLVFISYLLYCSHNRTFFFTFICPTSAPFFIKCFVSIKMSSFLILIHPPYLICSLPDKVRLIMSLCISLQLLKRSRSEFMGPSNDHIHHLIQFPHSSQLLRRTFHLGWILKRVTANRRFSSNFPWSLYWNIFYLETFASLTNACLMGFSLAT